MEGDEIIIFKARALGITTAFRHPYLVPMAQLLGETEDEAVERVVNRPGACCPHPAIDHIMLRRAGTVYEAACWNCPCCFWKEKDPA